MSGLGRGSIAPAMEVALSMRVKNARTPAAGSFRTVLTVVLVASLSGCAVGPDFDAPPPPDVSRYTKETLAPRTTATNVPLGAAQHFVNGRDIAGEWWRIFRSPGLNALIERSLVANPSLTAALATLRQTREMVYAQQGKYFPTVTGNLNPTRQLVPAFISSPLANSATLFNLITAQLVVSYTLDIWGANRRAVESLQATADNQRFQVEAAYLTLTSNVVLAAITDASLRGQIDATNNLIAINGKMLDTLRTQFDQGLVGRADVAVQEAALAQIRATLPPLRKALAQNRDLLAALAGRFPSQDPPEIFKLTTLRLPVELPLSVPSQLVQQRPDIRAAEELVHAASANVGVAVANMLPQLTLGGTGGYQATNFAMLFSPASAFWTIGANATQPLFDGFTLLHQRRAADAAFESAREQYRQTVITAFQNVADALRAIQNDADALKAQSDFEVAAKVSFDLAQQQINAGNANILFVLTAQVTYEQAVLAVVQAQAARLSDTAALYMALGGGWWNRIDLPPDQGKNALTTLISDKP